MDTAKRARRYCNNLTHSVTGLPYGKRWNPIQGCRHGCSMTRTAEVTCNSALDWWETSRSWEIPCHHHLLCHSAGSRRSGSLPLKPCRAGISGGQRVDASPGGWPAYTILPTARSELRHCKHPQLCIVGLGAKLLHGRPMEEADVIIRNVRGHSQKFGPSCCDADEVDEEGNLTSLGATSRRLRHLHSYSSKELCKKSSVRHCRQLQRVRHTCKFGTPPETI